MFCDISIEKFRNDSFHVFMGADILDMQIKKFIVQRLALWFLGRPKWRLQIVIIPRENGNDIILLIFQPRSTLNFRNYFSVYILWERWYGLSSNETIFQILWWHYFQCVAKMSTDLQSNCCVVGHRGFKVNCTQVYATQPSRNIVVL